jgi:hypothetical protein
MKDIKTDKFVENKNTTRENIIKLVDKGENLLSNYEAIKETNLSVFYSFDKMITESVNAIKVYVKARDEAGYLSSDAYKKSENCVYIKHDVEEADPLTKEMKSVEKFNKYGQFEKVYWSNSTLADLYCGEGIDCKRKVALSGGVRDMISIGFKSNIFFTYGFSGSGKTTLLLGRKGPDENNAMGVISRLITDLLDEVYIPSSGTRVEANYMIGEIYGEKLKLSLLDNEFAECFYIWDTSDEDNLKEKMYTSDLVESTETAKKQEQESKKLALVSSMNVLETIKNMYYNPLNDPTVTDFKINNFDILKAWRYGKNTSVRDFDLTNDLNKYVGLKGGYGVKADIDNYKDNFGLFDLKNNKSRTLYEELKDETNYKAFSRIVKNKDDVTRFSRDLADKLNTNIDNIQLQRRKNNRVRCTKFNPDSSRSHMFFIVKIKQDTILDDKYFIFIE